MFATAAAAFGCAISVLYAAPGRKDFLARAIAHAHAANSHRLLDLAVGQQLRRALARANQSRFRERLSRDFLPANVLEVAEAHDLVLDAERILEAALRQPARHRHLAAFEVRLAAARAVVARARLDSLVSLAGSLACARARPAADALAVTVRARRRHEIVQPDLVAHFSSPFFTGVTLIR